MGQGANEMNRDEQLADALDQSAITGEQAGDRAPEGSDDTDEIRTGIEQTRAEMSETIDAIQDRLSPQHIKEQVKEQMREQFQEAKETVREATIGKAEEMVRNAGETISEARSSMMETIRQNPIPAAMVGIGLGWLFMNRSSAAPQRSTYYTDRERYYRQGYYAGEYPVRVPYTTSGRQYDDRGGMIEQGQRAVSGTLNRVQETAGDVVNRAQETVGDIADRAQQVAGSAVNQAQETVGSVVSQAQEAAGYIADQAQYQAQRVEDRFQQVLYQNPLAVGAVALALGTAVGFSLPQTRRENELLGEARDNLVERAQEVAQDTLEKVRQVAGDVVDQAQTTAEEKAREQGLTSE